MASRTVADRPFSELDIVDSGARHEADEIDVVGRADETFEDTHDPLNPARGILLALSLSLPFWVLVVYWLIW
jgi:hypothetical protein